MEELYSGMFLLMISVFLIALILLFVFIEINYWSRKINKRIKEQREQIRWLKEQMLKRSPSSD